MKVTILKKVSKTDDHFFGKALVPYEGNELELKNAVVKQTENKAELVILSDIPTTFGGQPVKRYKNRAGESKVIIELPEGIDLKAGVEIDFPSTTIVHTKFPIN